MDRLARRLRNTGDERNLDPLRETLFADLVTGASTTGNVSGTAPATVFLHMPVDTALSMSDDGCELTGFGPIPGPIARDIMTHPDSVLRKVLVDPGTGRIESLGRRRRRTNRALRDLIAVRDRECPFCHRPAHLCDDDHLAEWDRDHGRTDPGNLGAKCEHHHYLKDADGWDLDVDPDTGVVTITTPAGRTYTHIRDPITGPRRGGTYEPGPDPPPRLPSPPPLPDDPPF